MKEMGNLGVSVVEDSLSVDIPMDRYKEFRFDFEEGHDFKKTRKVFFFSGVLSRK